jgi:hypothetical protein
VLQQESNTEPFIEQALEEGVLFEINSVIANARLPISYKSFICTETFDRRINVNTDGKNAYTETVRLLEAFIKAVEMAPENTQAMQFKYDDWVCRVVVHERMPCLVFSEEK